TKKQDVDARDISAFTRVFRRAMRGHDERMIASLPGLTRQSIPLRKSFSRRGWMRGSSPRMTMVTTSSYQAPHKYLYRSSALSRADFASLLAHPNRGWRSAERRAGAAAPVGPADDAAGQALDEAPCVP